MHPMPPAPRTLMAKLLARAITPMAGALALLGLGLVMVSAPLQAASSRDNRADSILYVGTFAGVHVPSLMSTPNVVVATNLGPNFQVGVEAGSNSINSTQSSSSYSGSYSNMGLFTKWFPGTNSLYFSLGAHSRVFDVRGSYSYTDATYGSQVTVKAGVTSTLTAVTLGIGNQWNTDFGLSYGIDWLLLTGGSPTANVNFDGTAYDASTDTTVSLSSLSASQYNNAKRQVEDGAKALGVLSAIPGVFVFTIGYQF